MSDSVKKAKVGPQSRPPTCKYEKARRDRLNVIITQLSTFLPEQNPVKSLSKKDILEKIVHLIKCLLDDKIKLTNSSSVDECLKKELNELKSTVFNLKARIVTLNKILKEAQISVPQDLEVAQFDKSFTPHLRYSCPKKTLTSQSTQTDSETTCNQPKPCHNVNNINKTQEKVNDDESVEKLISFTNNLKAPLKEIQMNALPPPPLPPPPQIIVVPYWFPSRPAVTQLTYTNKRPITSYTDFKKIFIVEQQKQERKRRRRRQNQKSNKKCTCKSVLLKKPDGALKKIIRLCGFKTCKNKTKFLKIHEQAKQQLNEQAKEEKAKKLQKQNQNKKSEDTVILNDKTVDKDKRIEVNNLYPSAIADIIQSSNTYEPNNSKHIDKFEKEVTDGFSYHKPLFGESQTENITDKSSEQCYYPYYNTMEHNSYQVNNEEVNYTRNNKHHGEEHLKSETVRSSHSVDRNMHSIDNLNHKSSNNKQEMFANRNLNQENTQITSTRSSNDVNNISNIGNSNKSNSSCNNRETNINNSTGDVGSYSINSVIFSGRSRTNDPPSTPLYETIPNQTQFNSYSEQNTRFVSNDKNSATSIFTNQVEHKPEESLNTNSSKRSIRKNLTFSFETLGSNVMSSETNEGFGYNVTNENATSSTIYPQTDNYSTTEQNPPSFYKTNSIVSGDLPYIETNTNQEKSSCYFESHPNALHFPYVPPRVDNKRKASCVKQKAETCHDISQNIFEVNNKENSFEFLLNTPQKSKRKSDSCLLTDKTFLLEEMRFHSEFSNDLFSLPGQAGGQNLECVSPTAAFLHTFPRSSKQTELLPDNMESANTSTPIGNIESLSQDMTDFTFKSNAKGLFDPFYPSCIGTDSKLNFDLNTIDNVAREDLLGKSNFLSCSEVTGVPWSANIFSSEESPKKKCLTASNTQDKPVTESDLTKPSQSKCSQTLFSYTDTGNTSKSLVNWMTSGDAKKPNNALHLPPPEPLPISKGLTTVAPTLTWHDAPLPFYSNPRSETQEQQADFHTNNSENIPSSNPNLQNETRVFSSIQSHISTNPIQTIHSKSTDQTSKKYPSTASHETSVKDVKSKKSLFDEKPSPMPKTESQPFFYYTNPTTTATYSNSSSFLSVSQLVDHVKKPSDPIPPTVNKKENSLFSGMKESIGNDSKHDNYSTEALLSSPQVMPPLTYKPVDTKMRYKRKRSDTKANNNAFSSIYNVTTTYNSSISSIPSVANAIYSTSNHYATPATVNYNSYYMGSTTVESWNKYPGNAISSNGSNSVKQQNCFEPISNGNYLPPISQNYFPSSSLPSATSSFSKSSIPSYPSPIFTSGSQSQHHDTKAKQFNSRHRNVSNTSKTSSISVGTQVVTSSFPHLPDSHSSSNNTYSMASSVQSLTLPINSTSLPASSTSNSVVFTLPSMNEHPPRTTSCTPGMAKCSQYAPAPSSSQAGLHVNAIPPPIPSVTYSTHAASSFVPPPVSTSKLSSNANHISSSTLVNTSNNQVPMKPAHVKSNTSHSSVTSRASYSKPSSFSTGILSTTPVTTSSNTSSISYSATPTSLPYLGFNTSAHSTSPYARINSTTVTCSNLSYSSCTPVTSFSLSYGGLKPSVTASSSYSPLLNSTPSSFLEFNPCVTSSSILPYSTSNASFSLSYPGLNNAVTSSHIALSGFNSSVNTSSSLPYSMGVSSNAPVTSFSLSYSGFKPSVSASVIPQSKGISSNFPATSSSASILSYSASSLSNAGIHTSVTSSSKSYSGLNSYMPSSSLAYSSVKTSAAVTSSSLSNVESSVTSSSSFNSGLKLSTGASSGVSYTSCLPYGGLNTSDLNTSVVSSYSSVNTCSESSGSKNTSYPVPMTLYPPVTSSVTDFNLSTIFPEINDKNQNSARGQLCSNHRHYHRSKSHKS